MPMSMRNVAAIAILLVAGWSVPASGQTRCDDALREAQKSYDLGLFDDVPGQLGPCLEERTSRRTALQVRALLARTYLQTDDVEKARKEVSALLRLDSTYEAGTESPRFAALIAQVRREELTTQVASVSKTSESLREAPATVVVMTGDEIRQRGYLDLEQFLHDVPGFDISRINGDIYSVIYQRGYRSPYNDRLLVLVDGVEQNDLSLNVAFFARQYPLINIDRVEIVYGPASTMYGANAYTGVISILTREPEAFLGEKKLFSVDGQLTSGGYGSHYLDLNLAGRDGSGTLAWTVAGSFARTKERDLSGFPEWDTSFRGVDYVNLMRLTGPDADDFFDRGRCANPSPWLECLGEAGVRTIELTPAGAEMVRQLDSRFITDNGHEFQDRARDWSVFGKLRISNLTLGLDVWTSNEGLDSANRVDAITGGTAWKQRLTAVYVKYSLPLDRVKVSLFTRFQQTATDRTGTQYNYLHNYARGYLSLWSLVPPCDAPFDPQPVSCAPATPWIEQANFGSLSDQLRSELTVVYSGSERLNVVAGLEFVKSAIQSQFDEPESGPGYIPPLGLNPEQTEHADFGLYAQGSYKVRPDLKLVLAGRVSHGAIFGKPGVDGFGTLFTPRAGIIYMPGSRRLVLKAIYSEAFKDPTDFQKFGTLKFVNEIPSDGLEPERVKNIELSAGWEWQGLALEGSLYQARYSDVVGFRLVRDCELTGCLQYVNRDTVRIRGLEATGRYRRGSAEVWANYTHVSPYQQNPDDIFGDPIVDETGQPVSRQRVADIATHHLNAGVDGDWRGLRGSFKVRYTGERRTGAGTTEPANPFQSIAAHTVADAALSYRFRRDTALQLIVQNMTDGQYFDPGVEFTIGSPRIPQPGRTIYLRLSYGLWSERSF